MTKQFTAAALLHVLWHRGPSVEALKAALEQPLINYLLAGDPLWDGAMPVWANQVTLHQLLTHTSGIVSYTEVPEFDGIVGTEISAPRLADMFKTKPLNFKQGEKFEYCNSGYFLIGEVVARISGKPLSRYLADNFFTPLAMKNSFMPDTASGKTMKGSGQYPNLARGYTSCLEEGSLMVEIETYWDNSFLNGAGAIVSTVDDMIIWNLKLYNNKPFPKEVTDLMLAEHVRMDSESSSVFYCYGTCKAKIPSGDVFTHDGGLDGFSSNIFYRPVDGLSFVAFTNLGPNPGDVKEKEIEATIKLYQAENPKASDEEIEATIALKFPRYNAHDLPRLDIVINRD